MASTATPYGLVPVKNADGSNYVGARNAYPIKASSYNVNIYNGTVVILKDGFVQIAATTGEDNSSNNFAGAANAGALGVFVGCEYINSEGQLVFNNYFPANTANATAYVVDDPNVTFQAQADGAVAQAFLGRNTSMAAAQDTNAGSTATGKSNIALDADAVDAKTEAFKIIGFSDRPGSAVGDAKTDLLVKFNPEFHLFSVGSVTS